jgi:hypothetical protein
MKKFPALLMGISLCIVGLYATVAHAGWESRGKVQNINFYLDTDTGLEWTVTIGRVRSDNMGKNAAGTLNAMGFRLPTFQELKVMYNEHGGGQVLQIHNGLLDYYETSDSNILGNAFGNGIQNPQPRKGIGMNWYLGVRNGQVQPIPPTVMVPERPVHVILCGLTNGDKIGEFMKINLRIMATLVREQIPANSLDMHIIEGNDCNASNIMEAIDRLQINDRDTLFVYYGGHGAYDPSRSENDPSGGHHFQIPSGDLMRKALMDRMLGKNAALTVLISDTCNVASFAHPHPEASEKGAGKTLAKLLMTYRGIVDINASSAGQYGWSSGDIGGWFTSVACRVFRDPQISDWNDAFNRLAKATDAIFQSRRNQAMAQNGQVSKQDDVYQKIVGQTHMTPVAFRLDVQIGSKALVSPTMSNENELPKRQRFGVELIDSEDGAEVVNISPGSPATRIISSSGNTTYLEPGDVIVSVDGHEVEGANDCVQAVNSAGTTMKIRILNVRDDEYYDYTVDLSQ